MKVYTYLEIFPDNRPNWISKLELNADIEERIKHCNANILFWRDQPEIRQVWLGVKEELERIMASFNCEKQTEVK